MNFQGQYSYLNCRNVMQRDQTTVQTFRLTLAVSQPWFPPVSELDEEEKSSTMFVLLKTRDEQQRKWNFRLNAQSMVGRKQPLWISKE